jgi:hypothetical protein
MVIILRARGEFLGYDENISQIRKRKRKYFIAMVKVKVKKI